MSPGSTKWKLGERGPSGSSAEPLVRPTTSHRLWPGDWYVGPYVGSVGVLHPSPPRDTPEVVSCR
jgi:hypothetical protein